jgi:tyrosine-protein phosphatase YwqE
MAKEDANKLMRLFKNIFRSSPKQSFTDFSFIGTDIHSHLIPGIDDGSKSMADTLELIAGMQELGFNHIITSPHVMMEYYPNTTETISRGGEEVLKTLKDQGAGISFGYAAEYFLDDHFESLIEKDDLLTIGDKYVLFELSFFEPPRQLREVIFNLKVKQYQPILAHAERYGYWARDVDQFKELKEAGCLLQLNLLSVLGHYGPDVQKLAEQLIDEKLYDFAGTDVHHMAHIEKLKKGLEKGEFGVLNGYEFRNNAL